jgi:hypothetical protein
VLALRVIAARGLRHPLAPAVALQCVFVLMLGRVVLASNLNGPRAVLALVPLTVLMLATPNGAEAGAPDVDLSRPRVARA